MHNICCAARKRWDLIETESQSQSQSGFLKPKPDGEPEPLLCLGELWPHALGSGHKKQFSGTHKEREAEAAAITITCFVINYSLRNAGDRPKTTTVTVTQGSRLVGCLDGWMAGRKLDLTMCSSSSGLGRSSSSKTKKKAKKPKENKKEFT